MNKHTSLLRLLLSIFVAHLWFIAVTSAHRKLSSIAVGVSVCTPEIQQAVVEELAAQRRAQHLPPLKTTPEMMQSAKQWANAKGAGVYYKRGTATVGEYTISVRNLPDTNPIDLSKTDLFAEWRQSPLASRPWYMGGEEGKGEGEGRRFTDAEWARTREFGIGCGTWSDHGAIVFWLTLHFRYPTKTSSVELGSFSCPRSLVQSTLAAFNQRRRNKGGMRPLRLTRAMTASARKAVTAPRTLLPNYELAGQYVIRKIEHDKSCQNDGGGDNYIDLRGLNLLGGKLSSSSGAPWYTGDTDSEEESGRFFTDDEWRRTAEMGVSCHAYAEESNLYGVCGGRIKHFLMVVHFKFPTDELV